MHYAAPGFIRWSKASSSNKHDLSKDYVQSRIPRNTSSGYPYRRHCLPPRTPQLFHPNLTVEHLEKNGFFELPSKTLSSTYLQVENRAKIATLNHGLERVLESPGVHYVRNPVTKEYNFSSYVGRLHHPSEIDYNLMPAFVTTSKDQKLHRLALSLSVRWKGSTSSVSNLLTHIYHLWSNFRPTNLHNLSDYFQAQTARFPPSAHIPASVTLIPQDGIYSIDKYQPECKNTVLSDLGKSYERMITMNQEMFEQAFLKSSCIQAKMSDQPEAYNYMNRGNFLLRSQLDCYDKQVGIFDLKSRATNPIRIFPGDDPSLHINYRLSKLTGPTHSYEREFYDMIRSAFLRNIFQVRIGDMSGIFVAYHNTREIFGFEYLPLDEMEQCVFQSKKMADDAFDVSLKILDLILDHAVGQFEPGTTLRLVIQAKPLLNKRCLHIFVEKVTNALQERLNLSDAVELYMSNFQCVELLRYYTLTLETVVNNRITLGHLNIDERDDVRTWAKIERVESSRDEQVKAYVRTLEELYTSKGRKTPQKSVPLAEVPERELRWRRVRTTHM
ncbi:uncharacterized protein LOC126325497 [Schistocerca gregaria]|uniref:uncharacterized protein LOC126325497 n=1 Tax=Schistocerca gregaria TaxID=7010 RepID=UPI00211E1921|nr:uncharacterized protein LOC126325497 [Schistocerca gregaria]